MASKRWKPLYEYKNSFFREFLCVIFGVFLLGIGIVLLTTGAPGAIIVALLPGCLGLYVLSLLLTRPTARKRMRSYNIESVCETSNDLLFGRTGTHTIGLFKSNGNVVFKPEFRNIVIHEDYYLLEKPSGEWGIYNMKLNKYILDCEYSSVQVERSGNLTGIKAGTRYTFTPYGSLLRQTKADDNIDNMLSSLLK